MPCPMRRGRIICCNRRCWPRPRCRTTSSSSRGTTEATTHAATRAAASSPPTRRARPYCSWAHQGSTPNRRSHGSLVTKTRPAGCRARRAARHGERRVEQLWELLTVGGIALPILGALGDGDLHGIFFLHRTILNHDCVLVIESDGGLVAESDGCATN